MHMFIKKSPLLASMKVHLVTKNGSTETIECESVWESDNGLYLMKHSTQKLDHAVGYVPFDRLDYVEPTDD